VGSLTSKWNSIWHGEIARRDQAITKFAGKRDGSGWQKNEKVTQSALCLKWVNEKTTKEGKAAKMI